MEPEVVEDLDASAAGYEALVAQSARDGGVILCEGRGSPCIFMWTDCNGKLHKKKVQPGGSVNVKIKKVVFEGGGVKEKCVSQTWKCPKKKS